jgi:hypothetical protein
VELIWREKQIEYWIRFGRDVEETILDRRRRVLSFAPNTVPAFVRWAANDYGTVVSRLDIARAVLPALNDAALLIIEVDQAAHSHLGALCSALVGWVLAFRHTAQQYLGLLAGGFCGQSAESPDSDGALGRRATAALGPIPNDERLRAARLDPDAESREHTFPEVV